jgi:hypothetical protein
MSGEAEDGGRRRAPVGAIVALGVFLAVLLVAAALFARGALLNAKLARRKAEIRAAGLPAGIEDVVERRNADAFAVIAARDLLAALEALEVAYANTVSNPPRPPFGARHSDAMREALVACMSDVSGRLPAVREAAVDAQSFPLEPGEQPWGLQLPHLNPLRVGARALAASARLRAEAGDTAGAVDELTAILRLADSLQDDPLMLEHLVMAAVDAIGVEAVEVVLGLAELPPDGVAQVRTLLEGDAPSPAAGLAAERAFAFSTIGQVSALDAARMGAGSGPLLERAGARLRFMAPGRRAADALFFDGVTEESLAACAPDPRERRLAAEALSVRLRSLGEKDLRAHPLAAMLMPATGRFVSETVQHEARLRVAATALAAEQWRLEHGRWPESLEQLAPGLLPGVPQDPYSEGKLLYRRTDEGVVVYSVGEDGADDGGVPFGLAGQAAWQQGRGWDLSFRLLDAGRRGAATLTFGEDVMESGADIFLLQELGFDEKRLRELGLDFEDLQHLRARRQGRF